MIILNATNQKITIDLTENVTTNQLDWTVSYIDISSSVYTPSSATGTTNNIYYLRDCCGFSSAYGGKPTSFGTTYCNDSVRCCSAGPWCNGNSYDGNGDFAQGGTLYGSNYHGGTD